MDSREDQTGESDWVVVVSYRESPCKVLGLILGDEGEIVERVSKDGFVCGVRRIVASFGLGLCHPGSVSLYLISKPNFLSGTTKSISLFRSR